MVNQMLAGIKVVEWGNFITAPFCTKVMADWGAEVIKVEMPGVGDEARMHGPFPQDEPDAEKSGLFLALNTNKKSVTLNLKDPTGREILKRILKDADIFVENNPPSLMKELGLDYDSIKKDFPKLIMISITPWGQTGPYRDFKGYCLNTSGTTGVTALAGSMQREPLDHPMSYVEYQASLGAADASMIALFDRDKTGLGQYCDLAVYENEIAYQGCQQVAQVKMQGAWTQRWGMHSMVMQWPWGIFHCKDGYMSISTLEFSHWERLLEVLGNPEWSKDPKWHPEDRTLLTLAQHWAEGDKLVTGELKKYTKAELFEKLRAAKTPFLPIQDIKDMVESPQTKFRNEILEFDHPRAGKLLYPGAPAVMSETPFQLKTSAPLLGQDNLEILGGLGYTKEDMVEFRRAGII